MFALTTFPFCLLVATLEATPILSEHLQRVCRGDQSGWGSSVTRLSLFLAEQMRYERPSGCPEAAISTLLFDQRPVTRTSVSAVGVCSGSGG